MGGEFSQLDFVAFPVAFIPFLIELAFALRWTAQEVVFRWRRWRSDMGMWWGFSAPLGAYMWLFMFAIGGAGGFIWWRNAFGVVGYGGYASVLGLYFAFMSLGLLWQGPFLYGPAWWPIAVLVSAGSLAGSLAATIIIGINAARHGGVPVLWGSFALTLAFAFFMFVTFVTLAIMSWYRSRTKNFEGFVWTRWATFWGEVGPGPETINTRITTAPTQRPGVLLNNGQPAQPGLQAHNLAASAMAQGLRQRPGVPVRGV